VGRKPPKKKTKQKKKKKKTKEKNTIQQGHGPTSSKFENLFYLLNKFIYLFLNNEEDEV